VNRRTLLLGILSLAACARALPPPGGPTDRAPPRLLSTHPDSLEILTDFKGDVEFRFDEVVSEGGAANFGLGTGDLERLIILSPSTRVPKVSWKRSRITVRPREGWRPNTVYRVELLPGLADLSNNRSQNGRIITFTTGAPLPTATLRGRVVDWQTQRPPQRAMVDAVHLPDSASYRTQTDSAGRFELGPLPPGEYLVYGVLDQNNDFRRGAREPFDSVRIAPGRDSVGEIWAFRHDTTAARITTAVHYDSLSILLTFSQSLDPYQRLPADSAAVRLLPDSVPIRVVALLTKEAYDTAYPTKPKADTTGADSARVRARADSVRADSIARAREAAAIRIPGAERRRTPVQDTTGTGPLKTKPPLFDKLYIRVAEPLKPGSNYAILVRGVRNLSGLRGSPRAVVRVPEVKPTVDTSKAKAKADTARSHES
jgi:hypothetical protein